MRPGRCGQRLRHSGERGRAGGGIRIHDVNVKGGSLRRWGSTRKDIETVRVPWRPLVRTAHGIAYGLDRLLMLPVGGNSIRT